MDPTTLELTKTHMETILQNNMQETTSSLRKELIDQKEAHRKELATLQQQLIDLQKGWATHQTTLQLEKVDERQVSGQVPKKARVDQGGQSRIVRKT